MTMIINPYVFTNPGSGGGASSLPTGVPAPVAWYDADALTGADGSNVSTWTDRMAAFDATN
jgi:hypothetical protein